MQEILEKEIERSLLFPTSTMRPSLRSPIPIPYRDGPNGRTLRDAVPYCDPFDDGDILECALDAEFVWFMEAAPTDLLDQELAFEEHIAQCEVCAVHHGAEVCAHCLELRVVDGESLCRNCRRKTINGMLDVA
jgi:hypothetical protein